jgi:hypothetical protein
MGVKDDQTPLRDTSVVDDVRRKRLAELGITTVEELVGQLAADPEALGCALDLKGGRLTRLRDDARAALPPETRGAFDAPPRHIEAYGAMPPDEND